MLLPQFLSFHSSVSFFNTIVCLFILLFPSSIINFFFSNISSTFLFFLLPCTVLYVLFSLFLSHLSFHTFIPSLPFLFSNFFFFFRFLCPSHYAPIAGMWIFVLSILRTKTVFSGRPFFVLLFFHSILHLAFFFVPFRWFLLHYFWRTYEYHLSSVNFLIFVLSFFCAFMLSFFYSIFPYFFFASFLYFSPIYFKFLSLLSFLSFFSIFVQNLGFIICCPRAYGTQNLYSWITIGVKVLLYHHTLAPIKSVNLRKGKVPID